MIDRLVALLIALTVAAPALTRPECCCVSPTPSTARCCQAVHAEGELSAPACCQTFSKLPACCRGDDQEVIALPCGCDSCPATRPADPLPAVDAPTRLQTTDDLPLAAGVVSSLTPVVDSARWAERYATEWRHPHRPPDLRALLCVWTI